MPRITHQPTDTVIGVEALATSTVLEFWQWAFSDLCDDDIKGIYAEWLVHKVLGIKSKRRISWANSDIITPGGTRIEVKSTAYWQSWKFLSEFGDFEDTPKHKPVYDDSKIRFAGLMARDSTSSDWEKAPSFKSDFYVFAFQGEKTVKHWNALDLSQWEFFFVHADELKKLGWKSISLTTLRTKFGALTAGQLQAIGRAAIKSREAREDDA